MASALYLENFLESKLTFIALNYGWALYRVIHLTSAVSCYFSGIEYLPPEMKRNFALIGDLDQRAQGIKYF